jgi:hypothetical protein
MWRPYSIMSPPFSTVSGGIRVMYGLRSWLETKGQIVFMNAHIDTDFVAVYPEIYAGNQAGAKTVVRYILNKPGVMQVIDLPGPREFEPTDKIFVFSKLFDTFNVDDEHLMFLPILNLHIFKDLKKKRKGKCFFIGKGQQSIISPTDFIIDRKFATNQLALAEYLNTVEVMYGYDPVSAMYDIARLCGCRVVIFPSSYSKEEFTKYELCQDFNGISWGNDEEKKLDVDSFRSLYEDMIALFSEKVDIFIELTQV